ncbi:RES family NAD+ phosphorylase [Acidisoma cellulosilytica]|uniref:RES family NAD+ phosphorylase n=1 Tax=Acidisoma cellulosilyticum TaxID=2802395 RepID=A0A963YYW9_9PROT|nr:RES family NAD+ phosphorylase [Acidisoma cellulosilyticum]MCB8879446.1 RES family NAD+ phosphorylase [Acidisoma cellulosilyticum]
MIGWRLCREAYADLSGQGAALYGGRWNSPGHPLVYLAETAALTVLEVRVHLDLPPELLPEDFCLVSVDLGDLPVEKLAQNPVDPQAFGELWLRQGRSPLLRVPSAIVPESHNLLLNPRHPKASAAQIASRRPFRFDARLWAGN